MGAVYLGYNEGKDQQVAIKVLGEHLASNQGYVDRFYREAKSGVLLNHPNIVRTLSVGQDQATTLHYLVLEFVDGQTAQRFWRNRAGWLSAMPSTSPWMWPALWSTPTRATSSTATSSRTTSSSRAPASRNCSIWAWPARLDEASHLTAARQGFGTTYYMPYEQAINAKYADGRSDIYALGATLYHLVTGTVPFAGENHLEVVEKKNQGVFTPASKLNPTVPPILDHILTRMLARNPRDRYQTASELIVDLERSRLSAPVPTFADPNQALQDPWVQQCLATSAEPTRLDPEMPPLPASASEPAPPQTDGVWVLRYRNPAGKVCRARATTEQILLRLRRGRLSVKVEARHSEAKDYHPLSFYPEFKNSAPPSPPRKHLLDTKEKTAAARSEPTSVAWYRRPGFVGFTIGAAGLLLLTVLVILYHFLHTS